MNRRGFLLGIGAALAAPAIVPYASLMPVKLVDWQVGRRYMPGDLIASYPADYVLHSYTESGIALVFR